MKAFNFVFAVILSLSILVIGSDVMALDLAQKRTILKEIRETASFICYNIEQSGSASEETINGSVQAGVTMLFKKLGTAGIGGSMGSKNGQFQNVLQKDLPGLIMKSMDCRNDVFSKLYKDFLTSEKPLLQPPIVFNLAPSVWNAALTCLNGQFFRGQLKLNTQVGSSALGTWSWSGSDHGTSEVTVSPSPVNEKDGFYVMISSHSNVYSYDLQRVDNNTLRGTSVGPEVCSIRMDRFY